MLENQELESGPFILSLWEVLHEWHLHKREPLQLDGSGPRWKALFCLPWFWVKILPETKLVLHHRIHLLSTGGWSLPIQQRVKQLQTARNRNPLLTLQVSHFEDAFFWGMQRQRKRRILLPFYSLLLEWLFVQITSKDNLTESRLRAIAKLRALLRAC